MQNLEAAPRRVPYGLGLAGVASSSGGLGLGDSLPRINRVAPGSRTCFKWNKGEDAIRGDGGAGEWRSCSLGSASPDADHTCGGEKFLVRVAGGAGRRPPTGPTASERCIRDLNWTARRESRTCCGGARAFSSRCVADGSHAACGMPAEASGGSPRRSASQLLSRPSGSKLCAMIVSSRLTSSDASSLRGRSVTDTRSYPGPGPG